MSTGVMLPFVFLATLALPALAGLFGIVTQFCALLLVMGAVANSFAATSHAHYVCDRGACNAAPLLDRGFDFINDHSSDAWLVSVIDTLPVLMFCALLVTLYSRPPETRNTVLISIALAFFARSVIVQATALPPAKQGNGSVPLGETAVSRLLSGTDGKGEVDYSLHDLMFSGHESLFVTSMLWLLYLHGFFNGPLRIAWLLVAVVAAAIEGVGLIAIRVHYTVDVLVGALVAALLFANGRQQLEKSMTSSCAP